MIRPELHETDPTTLRVLLVTKILISDHENVETRLLRRREQFAVLTAFPS